MKYYDIDTLTLSDFGDDFKLYDLTKPTYTFVNVQFKVYIVQEKDEMRIDNIVDMMYSNTDHIDTILNINGIINPLNIKKDMILIYPPESYIDGFKLKETDISLIKNKLLNLNPNTRKDKNRLDYNSKSEAGLPVTFTSKGKALKIENGQVKIGK